MVNRCSCQEVIIREGDSPSHGARELRRAIAQKLENPLASAIIHQHIRDGDRCQLDVQAGDVVTVLNLTTKKRRSF